MKLISWNVNGIRASSQSEGWKTLWSDVDFDILCLQEVKAFPEQLDMWLRSPKGYESFWAPAEKPGYSGLGIYSKVEPEEVIYGIGDEAIDKEGRVLSLVYKKVVYINSYFPNSQRDHARLSFKLHFCNKMFLFTESWRKKGYQVVLCGDFNIAHKEIDLRNPKSNENNAGFLPEERAWMDSFLTGGYVDVFRYFVKDPLHYTWWSYRPGVRDRNIGWRLDYFVTNQECTDTLSDVRQYTEISGSDHCPVWIETK